MTPRAAKTDPTKKEMILREAGLLGKQRFSPADAEELQRRILQHAGAAWKPSLSYISSVLEEAGFGVIASARADTGGKFEEEFHHLLHFATFKEAEKCLLHLQDLLRQFQAAGEKAAVERVFETARLGRQRTETESRLFMLSVQTVILVYLLDSSSYRNLLGGSIREEPLRTPVRAHVVKFVHQLLI